MEKSKKRLKSRSSIIPYKLKKSFLLLMSKLYDQYRFVFKL